LEGTPFLTRVAYEEALSRGTAYEFVVPVEQQDYKHQQSAVDSLILQEFVPETSSSSHDYAYLQVG